MGFTWLRRRARLGLERKAALEMGAMLVSACRSSTDGGLVLFRKDVVG